MITLNSARTRPLNCNFEEQRREESDAFTPAHNGKNKCFAANPNLFPQNKRHGEKRLGSKALAGLRWRAAIT
jgi:hypothetical protein